jgi:hypothetical protein
MKIGLFGRSLLLSGLCSALWISATSAASDLLTRAEIYKLINQAQLMPSNRPARAARKSDVMVPQDAIKTATKSRAELLFNEGSLARIGSNAIFRFIPGLRGFQLKNGIALIINLPSSTATKIETLEGQAIAEIPPTIAGALPPEGVAAADFEKYYQSSTAMMVVVEANSNKVDFYNLTSAPIKIMDSKGNVLLIKAGETVSVLNGAIGPVKLFDLRSLYNTSSLAAGLGLGQENLLLSEPLAVQRSLKAVRVATLKALDLQAKLLEGLCTLNSRGGASTLATNCITTDSDDPLRAYQDRRNIVTPIPEPGRGDSTPNPLPSPSVTPSPTLPTPTPTVPAQPTNNNNNTPVIVGPVLIDNTNNNNNNPAPIR